MHYRRSTKLLADVPTTATGDIAFNLIVFFLVCVSTQPDAGRSQQIPRSEETKTPQQEVQNLEVLITDRAVALNGDFMPDREFLPRLTARMADRRRPEDRVVVVKTKPETPFHRWIEFTALIEQQGGTVTIQREEEQEVVVP